MTKPSTVNKEHISWFPVPSEDQLPENLRGLFAKAKEKLGFVPNVFRVYSFRPERFGAWFAHYKQLHEPTDNLNAAEREMIAVAVSMEIGHRNDPEPGVSRIRQIVFSFQFSVR